MKTVFAFLAMSVASTIADSVCQSGINTLAATLQSIPAAVSFCNKNYPAATATVTATATSTFVITITNVVTVTDTDTVTAANKIKRAPKKTTSIASTSSIKSSATPTTSSQDKSASVWASISSKYSAALSTLCSCMETHPTATVTITAIVSSSLIVTSTTTTTSTSTVQPTPATCPGTGIGGCYTGPPNSGNCGCLARYNNPGGYCVDYSSCGPPCSSDADCGAEVCVAGSGCNAVGGTCMYGGQCLAYPPASLFKKSDTDRSVAGRLKF